MGPRIEVGLDKGWAALSSTMIRWIHQTVAQAYAFLGQEPPFPITAHSTRVLSMSWAFHHSASVVAVCKGATLSVHAFTKIYKVDMDASDDASSGWKVFQAAT